MSLGNENDTIIPNTISPIRALADEVNNTKPQDIAGYIRGVRAVSDIVWGRVAGIPLKELVNPERISNEGQRLKTETKTANREGFYASLVGPER